MKAHLAAAVSPRPGEPHCDAVDRMPAALRPLVHEYGFSVVLAFLQKGIVRPKDIRHIMTAVWLGAREPGNRRAPGEHRGVKQAISALDRVLVAEGAGVPAIKVARALHHLGYVVMPYGHPTDEMVEASMATVANFDVTTTKRDKHLRRLTKALRAYADAMWGGE